jgi:hypothetical protein
MRQRLKVVFDRQTVVARGIEKMSAFLVTFWPPNRIYTKGLFLEASTIGGE